MSKRNNNTILALVLYYKFFVYSIDILSNLKLNKKQKKIYYLSSINIFQKYTKEYIEKVEKQAKIWLATQKILGIRIRIKEER